MSLLANVEAEFGQLKRRLEKRAEQRKIAQAVIERQTEAAPVLPGRRASRYRVDEHTGDVLVDEHFEAVAELAEKHGEVLRMDHILGSVVDAARSKEEAVAAASAASVLASPERVAAAQLESAIEPDGLRVEVDIGEVEDLLPDRPTGKIGAPLPKPVAVVLANAQHDEIVHAHVARWEKGKRDFIENVKGRYKPLQLDVDFAGRLGGNGADADDDGEGALIDAKNVFSNLPKIRSVLSGVKDITIDDDDGGGGDDSSDGSGTRRRRSGSPGNTYVVTSSSAIDKHNLALTQKKLRETQEQLAAAVAALHEEREAHSRRIAEIDLQHQLRVESFKATYEDEVSAMAAELHGMEESCAALRADLQNIQGQLRADRDAHRDELAALAKAHAAELAVKEREAAAAKARAEVAETKVEAQVVTIAALETDVRDVRGAAERLQESSGAATAALEAELAQQREAAARTAAALHELEAALADARRRGAEAAANAARLQALLESGDSAHAEAAAAQRDRIAELQAQLAAAAEEVNQQRQRAESAEALVRELQQGEGWDDDAATGTSSNGGGTPNDAGLRSGSNSRLLGASGRASKRGSAVGAAADLARQLETVLGEYERQSAQLAAVQAAATRSWHKRVQLTFLCYLQRRKIAKILARDGLDARLESLSEENRWLHEQLRLKSRRHVRQREPGAAPLVAYFEGDEPPPADEQVVVDCDKAVQTVDISEAATFWRANVDEAACQTQPSEEEGLALEVAAALRGCPSGLAAARLQGGVFRHPLVAAYMADSPIAEQYLGSVALHALGKQQQVVVADAAAEVLRSPSPTGRASRPPRPLSAASNITSVPGPDPLPSSKRGASVASSSGISVAARSRPASAASAGRAPPGSSGDIPATASGGSPLPVTLLIAGEASDPARLRLNPANYFVDRRRIASAHEEQIRHKLAEREQMGLLTSASSAAGSGKVSASDGWLPTSYAVGTLPVLTASTEIDQFAGAAPTDGPPAFKPALQPPSGAWRPRSASALRKFA